MRAKRIFCEYFFQDSLTTRLEPSSRLYLLASSRWLNELMGVISLIRIGLAIPYSLYRRISRQIFSAQSKRRYNSEFAGLIPAALIRGRGMC